MLIRIVLQWFYPYMIRGRGKTAVCVTAENVGRDLRKKATMDLFKIPERSTEECFASVQAGYVQVFITCDPNSAQHC